MIKIAMLSDIWNCLNAGGVLRFIWRTASPEIWINGARQSVDGRSYQAFLKNTKRLLRVESGSLKDGSLVIEWRYDWHKSANLPEYCCPECAAESGKTWPEDYK